MVAGIECAEGMVSPKSDPRREQTREQILEAVRTVLIEQGYEKITTRRIAEVAGVNIATLHYHFGSKEALLTEAVRHALLRTESRLRAAMEGAGSTAQTLERALSAILTMIQERTGVLRYDLAVRGFRDDSARREVTAVYTVYRQLIEEMGERHLRAGGRLAPGVTPPILAHYLVSTVDGIVFQHTISGDDSAAKSSLSLLRQHALILMQADSIRGQK